MGIQQCSDQEGRPMESSIQDKSRITRTDSNVLRNVQLTATFQAMMDSIFSDMIERKEVLVYMDDILIFAKTMEELERLTREVLKRLRDNDLFLKPKKCEFEKTEMEYLGLILKEGKLSMDPTKLNGIRDWPIPKTVKDVRSFLGFGNFIANSYEDLLTWPDP